MNIQDIVNEFRRLQGDITFVTVGILDTLLISSASHRLALWISPPQTSRVTITTAGVATVDQGWTLYPDGQPLCLSLWMHGNIVARQFRAIAVGAPQILG